MDSSTSASLVSPPKKRVRLGLGSLSLSEKQTIINMYKKNQFDAPEKRTTQIVSEIVETIGVAKSTVYRVVKEYKETGEITSPKQSTGRKSQIDAYSESVKNSVRQIIHGFFYKNELPTLDKILTAIKTRADLPEMSRSTLYKLMKQINFR